MTDFEIEDIPFHNESLSEWAKANKRHTNWPVVYTILNEHSVYVGETLNAA